MSQENLELVRRIYAEWERGNFGAATEWYAPDIRFETWMPDANENVIANGVVELRSFMRSWFAQWKNYRVIGDEFREVGDDKVFVAGRPRGVGRTSGVPVELSYFTLWSFRGRKVIRIQSFRDGAEAIEAAGLSE